MILVRFLLEHSRRVVILIIVLALVGGACNAALIATLNNALHAPAHELAGFSMLFLAFAAGRIGANVLSQLALTRFSQKVIARMRNGLAHSILASPLRDLEGMGGGRLNAALTEDVDHVTAGLIGLPHLLVNVTLLACGGVYLAWLSVELLVGIALLVVVVAAVHHTVLASGMRFLKLAREQQDRLFHHLRGLTEGMKELKLHRKRRAHFLEVSVATVTRAYSEHNDSAETRFILGANFSNVLFFSLVWALVFFSPHVHPVSAEALSGYVLSCLYLMGPLAAVMGSFSYLGRASVSLRSLERLGLALKSNAEPPPDPAQPAPDSFQCLELVGVTHTYHADGGDRPFQLGPLDLAIRPGELVFLVGGNGSGKSTFAKIVTGLYPPMSGTIRLDGAVVDDSNRDRFRQLFSAVFSDFYLFDSLDGLDLPDLDGRARTYLELLRLEHKVEVVGGVLSTTSLSQGQRKRLALLVAYLEDRPFYVFDEWAADQDPEFKEFFYTVLLPELRARRKAVLVITHDDRWFELADRLVKLSSGRILDARGNGMEVAQCRA